MMAAAPIVMQVIQSEAVQSVFWSLVTFVMSISLLTSLLLAFLFFRKNLPRSVRVFNVPKEACTDTLKAFRGHMQRFIALRGPDMERWWKGLTSAPRGSPGEAALRAVMAVWLERGKTSVLTIAYMMVNSGNAACRGSQDDEEGCRETPLDPLNAFYAFPGRELSVRGGGGLLSLLPSFGPVRSAASRYPDLQLGGLSADLSVWADRVGHDPVRLLVHDDDVAVVRANERVDLFLAAIPAFIASEEPRFAYFRFVRWDAVDETRAALTAAGFEAVAADGALPLDCATMPRIGTAVLVARGHVGALRSVVAGMGAVAASVGALVEGKLRQRVGGDMALLRDYVKASRRKGVSDPDFLLKLASLRGRGDSAALGMAADAAAEWIAVRADVDALVADGVWLDAATTDSAKGSRGFVAAADVRAKLSAFASRTQPRFQRCLRGLRGVGFSAGGLLQERGAWERAIDRLCVDDAAETALRRLLEPDAPRPCADPSTARLGAHGADYAAHLVGLNVLSYVENYVDDARRCASTERSNTAEARIFWRVFFHDILTAYIVKNTRKPHVGALGHRYDTESVVEYSRRYWNLKQQVKTFTAWTDRQANMLDAECSRFLLFKKAKASQLKSDDLDGRGAPVDANACFLRPRGGAAWLRWTADGLDARVGGRRASHLVVLTGVGAATRLGSADGGRVLRYQLAPARPAEKKPAGGKPPAPLVVGTVRSGAAGGPGDDLDASTMFACSFGPSAAADVLASELAVSVAGAGTTDSAAGAFLRADMTLAAPAAGQPGAAFELMWAHLRVPGGRGVLRVRLLCAATGEELALGPAGVTLQGGAIVSAASPPLRLVYDSDAAPLRAGVVGADGAVLRRGDAGKAAVAVTGVARSAEDAVTFHPAPSEMSGASAASAARAAGGRFAGSFYLRVDASGLFLNAGAGGSPAGGVVPLPVARVAVWFDAVSVMPSDVATLTELQGVTKWDAFVQA